MKEFIDIVNKMTTTEEPVLTEAMDYAAMFNPLWTLANKSIMDSEIDKNINDIKLKAKEFTDMAKKSLKKNDRIVWYLKLVRITLASQIMVQINLSKYHSNIQLDNDENTDLGKFIKKEQAQFSPPLENVYNYQWLNRAITTLEHSLSLPIPDIQNMTFTNQNPEELIGVFNDVERDWKEKQNQILNYPAEEEAAFTTLIKFPDGKVWINLNKAYCETEGKAMGHCGNKAAYKEGDSILSLREPIKHGNAVKWRPCLTFILHEDGNLGEMKGRGNQKPAPQYHNNIIELLKLPIIKGIIGGGYAPERNFAITDLPEKEADELIEMKPSLGSLAYQYKRFGMTDAVLKNVRKQANDLVSGAYTMQYDPKTEMFQVDEMPLNKFIDENAPGGGHGRGRNHSDDNALEYAYEVSSGEQTIDVWDWVQPENVENLIDNLPDDLKSGLISYCKLAYPNEFDEAGDLDYESLYDILKNNRDDLLDNFSQAVSRGYENGTSYEIYNALIKCLKDWDAHGFHLQFEGSEDGKHIYIDAPVKLVIKAKDLIDNLSNADYCADAEESGHWFLRDAGPVLNEPNYGWSDYDESTAIESIREDTNLEELGKKAKEDEEKAIDALKTKQSKTKKKKK